VIAATILGAMLVASVHATAAQEPTATYRSEVNVVTWAIGFYLGTPKGGSTPVTHLTDASFLVVLDKKVPVAVTVLQPTPGSYHVHFNPPDDMRDGKKHRVDVTVLDVHPAKKRWKMKSRQMTFQKPASEERKP
jgi:hypothetical protein